MKKAKLRFRGYASENNIKRLTEKFGKGIYTEFTVLDSVLDDGSKRSILKDDILFVRSETEPEQEIYFVDGNGEVTGLGIAVMLSRVIK